MLDSDLEYLVVGSGLTGATVARVLRDRGKRVAVVDRRAQAGGNVVDRKHESGLTYHVYGPHYFRTNSAKVWDFVRRFSSFTDFYPTIKTLVDGRIEEWPLHREQLIRFAGASWTPAFHGRPHNFEEACLAKMPRVVFEKFVRGYTEKQWGVPAEQLSTKLAQRLVILEDGKSFGQMFRHSVLPSDGYGAFIAKLLDGIPVLLDFDYLKRRQECHPKICTVYSGPIDELFDFDLGKLQYRGQRREHSAIAVAGFHQPAVQLNDPSKSVEHVRTIEWKHLSTQNKVDDITLLSREIPYFPLDPEHYEYPMPDGKNAQLYSTYSERAASLDRFVVCGRLGEYRYLDMDQAIARALLLAERLLAE